MRPTILTRHRESLSIALQSLALHKTRSFLTMLGIIFGVGAVIAMLSIGEGARRETLEQIEVLGVRNIIIRSAAMDEAQQEDEEAASRPMGISLKDARAIEDVCPFVENLSVTWESEIEARTYEGKTDATLVGCTPAYEHIFNVRLSAGSFIAPVHMLSTANVCVIGSEAKQDLFGFRDPMYQLVKLKDRWFTVVGVVEPKRSAKIADVAMPRANNTIFIPLSTAMAKFPREQQAGAQFFMGRGRRFRFSNNESAYLDRNTIDQIAVQVKAETPVEEAARVITRLLRQRHAEQTDFTVTIPDQLIEQSQKTQGIFNIVMGAIAGISLLVGGIGIMNIMLAGVLERTREIGVRRAIGATRSMIVVQFLAEATLLSIVGGIAGIGVGWGLTEAITAYAGWRTIVSLWAVLLAFGVAAATGILFGWYPARRAADKDVIEALRYE
ncbi:MAG: ABC transporter permease [Ignavibacteriae bacterium]|nr:ABC transporter permease [Ignavibacteriota bacterium]